MEACHIWKYDNIKFVLYNDSESLHIQLKHNLGYVMFTYYVGNTLVCATLSGVAVSRRLYCCGAAASITRSVSGDCLHGDHKDGCTSR